MADYHLILIGESDFTAFFAETFRNELKILVIKNSNFIKSFSNALFPKKSYIPSEIEISSAYGQVCSDYFRIDLLHNNDLLSVFFNNDLKCDEFVLKEFLIKSSEYFDIINHIIIDNYPSGLFGLLRKRPLYFLKNYNLMVKLIKKPPCPTDEFKLFLKGLTFFFSPGEINSNYYKFYLLFSLLNKPSYKQDSKTNILGSLSSIDNNSLIEIAYEKTKWKVMTQKEVITADFVISTVAPHIFALNSIKNPFRTDYTYIFYEFLIEDIELPEPMLEELVYIDKNGKEYFAFREQNKLLIYTSYLINQMPPINLIATFVEQFIPYFQLEKERVIIKPTTIPYYTNEKRRSFRVKRNFYFLKNYDFPYYGADGEMLYRNKLRDIIWKKFLY